MDITISKEMARVLASKCRFSAANCEWDLTIGAAATMVHNCRSAGFGAFRCGDCDLSAALADYFNECAAALEAYAATPSDEEVQP